MKYREYLSAARKHVQTSEVLYDSLSIQLQQQPLNNGATDRKSVV